jgi:hypothetical protein
MRASGRGGVADTAGRPNSLVRIGAGGFGLFMLIVAVASMGAAVLTPPGQAACTVGSPRGDVRGLPARARQFAPLYVGAAAKYELGARGPAILASIHEAESGFGVNQGPSSAGAVGQMQFLPATWEQYGIDGDGDGRADPANAADAIYTAARYLEASGAPRDWYGAIFAYNHANWYVDQILEGASRFGDVGEIAEARCASSSPAGPANLSESVRLYEPKGFRELPTDVVAPGFGPIKVETRIYSDAVWLLRRYDLLATAGAESGHNTHGDGTAVDAVPAGSQALSNWRATAEQAARDLGWTPGCAASGVAGVCPLVPAIQGVFYNGYPHHGDPAHSDIPHVHVSWKSSSYGTSVCCVSPEWIEVFPAPAAGAVR